MQRQDPPGPRHAAPRGRSHQQVLDAARSGDLPPDAARQRRPPPRALPRLHADAAAGRQLRGQLEDVPHHQLLAADQGSRGDALRAGVWQAREPGEERGGDQHRDAAGTFGHRQSAGGKGACRPEAREGGDEDAPQRGDCRRHGAAAKARGGGAGAVAGEPAAGEEVGGHVHLRLDLTHGQPGRGLQALRAELVAAAVAGGCS
mmetsp:Transcript_34988/g.92385  ORF Transcript_34988/g.92385 Transcript_34988/m.92385 type:complete len:203 (+) Transcript_34988:489-1097(+)